MTLQLYEEQVTPTGGHKSEGVQNVLGRPPLNWITVVLREAVQNSWDARKGNQIVEFQISWWRPDKRQKATLRDAVFTNQPSKSQIRQEISKNDFDVMTFIDRGTKGLGGPVLANEDDPLGQKRNFVDFVWEIGRSEAVGAGGGTYGYGKTSFFRLSKVRAICVYSRCEWQGQMQDRLIAAYLGPSSPKRTGRAWWGDTRAGDIRPLTGSAARKLASELGIPTYAGTECGTSIMVLCPRVEDLSRDEEAALRPTRQQVLRTLAESIVQWFWPKMIDLDGTGPPMRFRIFDDGTEFAVPSPESVPPFNVYVEGLRLLSEHRKGKAVPSHGQAKTIESLRPHATLGHLALVKRAKKNRNANSGEFGESSARELFGQSHHVVLLRKPMLVVKYLRGARPPSDQIDYAGVFVVDHTQLGGAVEEAFALSEPPTHDDWVPQTLEDRHSKTFVRVALRRIREAFNEFVAPISIAGGADTQQALGAFSEMLGDLLAGSAQGTGARIRPQPAPSGHGGRGPGPKKSRIDIVGPTRVEMVNNERCLIVPFRVIPAKGANEARIRAIPVVLLEQGAEKEPPQDAPVPRIHSYCRVMNGNVSAVPGTGDELTVPSSKAESRWLVRVSLPEQSRVRVDFTVLS